MKRTIKGLTHDAFNRIEQITLDKSWLIEHVEYWSYKEDDDGLIDITFSNDVIIKVHDDRLTLDLGGKIEFVEFNEFYAFVVT